MATLIGDMNVLWICIFLSFFGPSMLMKKGSEAEQHVAAAAGEDHTAGDV